MKRHRSALLTLVVCLAFITSVSAATGKDILGTWLNEAKDAKIEIFQCGNDYCGKIIWLKEPTYPTDRKKARLELRSWTRKIPMPRFIKHRSWDCKSYRDFSFPAIISGRTARFTISGPFPAILVAADAA